MKHSTINKKANIDLSGFSNCISLFSKIILNPTLIILIIISLNVILTNTSKADGPPAKTNACVAGVTGAAAISSGAAATTVIGAPAAGVIAVGAGAFQAGYFITGLICSLFDPPDIVNAGVPVNLNSFLVHRMPNMLSLQPACDPILATRMDICMDYLDTMVALSRAIQTANDRYAGALLIGNYQYASDRHLEFNNFMAYFDKLIPVTNNSLLPVFARLNQMNPVFLNNIMVPKSTVLAYRDSVAAGHFPSFEMVAINNWAYSPVELSLFSSTMQSLQDTSINSFYNSYIPGSNIMPLGTCLQLGTYGAMETCLSGPYTEVTSLIEGLYDPITLSEIKDTVKSYLRNIFPPYNLIDSAAAITDINGKSKFYFSGADNVTPYYMIVKHRNSIETWSSGGLLFPDAVTVNYDFSISSSQAYGNNLKLKGTKYCIYSGDVNQDGTVDLADILLIFNDASVFASGYIRTDLNGDGVADLSDLLIAYINANNFVQVIRP